MCAEAILLAYNSASLTSDQSLGLSFMPQASSLNTPHTYQASGQRMLPALLAYVALLFYGSLYPFAHWRFPAYPLMQFLPLWPGHLDKGDVLQNVLVYAPFGMLCMLWLAPSAPAPRAAAMTVALGMLLSFGIETLQQFNPARVASTVDIAMNTLGSAGGALLATTIVRHTFSGRLVLAWRDRWFRPGPLANTGLVVIGFWMLSHTSPLVPTLDVGHLRHALAGLWQAAHDPHAADLGRLARYALMTAGLGVVLMLLVQPGKPVFLLLAAMLSTVLLAKVIVISRALSLEAICGSALAFAACIAMRLLPARMLPPIGIALIAAGFTASELAPAGGGGFGLSFNWIPFAGHMRSITALENILELFWPFMALAWLVRWHAPAKRTTLRVMTGAVLVGGAVFAMEWQQQWMPGRYGDMTQVLLCVAGWIIPWCVRDEGNR
jgi:VanZ family protein